MIDLTQEKLISFNDAAGLLPSGIKPDFTTWWRWYRHGVRGVRLDTVKIGKRRATSAEAVRRFIAAISALEDSPAPEVDDPRVRKRDDSTRFLERTGILRPAGPSAQGG